MLFHFRTPRTRDWGKYLKKLEKFLEGNDATAHLSAFVRKAQEVRSTLVKLLDECAKDVSRPDDIMKLLNEYLPILEQLVEGVEANNVKLVGYLDVVWTSFLTSNINGKSLSNSLRWDKVCCYGLLALAHYQKAVELHHLNRQISHKTKEKVSKQQHADFDPIFDEAPDASAKPQIFDDQERVKEISNFLKTAASLWAFAASLCPVLLVESGKNAFNVIPESSASVLNALSSLALINAQEFMVQLAVQTNKSPALTAKLSEGVSERLKQANHKIKSSLSGAVYQSIKVDFVLYLKIRSDLYHAIALKYHAKTLSQQEKYGECVACYQCALNVLKHAASKFPNDDKGKKKGAKQTSVIMVMQKSISKQTQSVKALFNAAQSENNSVYFEVVPKQLDEQPDGKFVIKAKEYKPNWQDL